jgi:hypothetical protein
MNRHGGLISAIIVALVSAGTTTAGEAARYSPPAKLAPLKLVPKPVDFVPERRAHARAALPAGVTEIPYVETAPEPALCVRPALGGYDSVSESDGDLYPRWLVAMLGSAACCNGEVKGAP